MERPNKEDYYFSSRGTCYVHKETEELWDDDVNEYINYIQSELAKERELMKSFCAVWNLEKQWGAIHKQ